MIDVGIFSRPDLPEERAVVSFELSNRDWQQLKNYVEWQNFLRILERVQNGGTLTSEQSVKNINPDVGSSIDKLIIKMADELSETMNKGTVRDSTVLALAELASARAKLKDDTFS